MNGVSKNRQIVTQQCLTSAVFCETGILTTININDLGSMQALNGSGAVVGALTHGLCIAVLIIAMGHIR